MKVAIQGEAGSNSHLAALNWCGCAGQGERAPLAIAACATSAEVFERLVRGDVELAVLPIENSLYGSIAEHDDLLLENETHVVGEVRLRVQHHVIALPGVGLDEVKKVLSHPVALAQCRGWLRAHPEIEAVAFYDTAGGVKHLVAAGLRELAAIAPALAAEEYGAQVLIAGVEDNAENYTRFYVLQRGAARAGTEANKISLVFGQEHRAGALVDALEVFRAAALNLTRIVSRPVPGRPWEYVFFVDVRFEAEAQVEQALSALGQRCTMVKELGRYWAAE